MSKVKNRIIKEIFPVILLLLLSFILIFYKQSKIPNGLAHDENELARAAFSLENKPYTPFTPVADGHGTPYLYILLKSFQIFGANKFALRLPNRIFGVISILLFYGILKIIFKTKKWGDWVSFLVSFILLTSRWYLNFARFSFEMPFLLCLELISLYGILCWQQKKKLLFLIISGIFAGLAFNSYQPGRIFFLLPLFALFLDKSHWKIYVIYLITFIICILPISSYLLTHPQNDIRVNQEFFLKNTELSLDKKVSFLTSNIVSTSMMFFWKGDMNGRHNYTGKVAINPIMFLLLVFGIIYSFQKNRNKITYVFSLYLLLSIAPAILTYPWENPNMLRTYTCLPSIVFFIGQGIIALFLFFSHKFKKNVQIITLVIVGIVCLSSAYEMRTYFIYQPLVFKQSFDQPDNLSIIRKNEHTQQK